MKEPVEIREIHSGPASITRTRFFRIGNCPDATRLLVFDSFDTLERLLEKCYQRGWEDRKKDEYSRGPQGIRERLGIRG